VNKSTLISALAVLATATTATHAGPGCMTGGKHPAGWYAPQAMHAPGYRGYAQPHHYGYRAPGMAALRPHYSPMPMMAGAGQYARPAQNAGSTQTTASPADGTGHGVESSTQASGEEITVRIRGMRFEPATLTVKPGTTVTWIQEDSAPHTVTGGNGKLRSDTLTGGQRFSHTFGEAGSYDYACNFHPMMKGKVVVEEGTS
jgi:amicyanin